MKIVIIKKRSVKLKLDSTKLKIKKIDKKILRDSIPILLCQKHPKKQNLKKKRRRSI